MRSVPLLLSVSSLIGCRAEAPEKSSDVGISGLEFTLGLESTPAGGLVPWAATLHLNDGSTIPEVAVVIASDVEAELAYDGTTLTPYVAGLHEITASTGGESEMYTASRWLRVDAGGAVSLDLQLSAVQTVAGDPLSYDVVAIDDFGNLIDPALTTVVADSPDVLIVDPNVVSTVPGVYTLSASLADLADAEVFRVVPGDPASIELSLSDEDLELYDTTVATAVVRDVYGNAVDADWDLVLDGPDARASGRQITFYAEGWYDVYARYDALEDLVGPILIDSTGPGLIIDEPERGGWSDPETGTVSGTATDDHSSIASLTVNGDPVAVDDDGNFTTEVSYDFGVNVLQTDAVDSDGNVTSDTRAVLQGDFATYGSGIGDGFAVRINQAGFDTLETMGEGLIAGTDLDGMIPNPAFSTSSESCIDLYFTEICITWYSITLYITNPYLGPADLEIDPNAGGYLDTWFTVYDPSIDWAADGDVLGIGLSASGSIYADSIGANMHLVPYVLSGVLGVRVDYVDAVSSGFVFDWDSWIYDVMSFFGLDLSGLVQSYMEDALESAISDAVPEAIADAVGDLEIAMGFDVGTNGFDFEAVPYSSTVDDLGMTLGLETYFTTRAWMHDETGLGTLDGNYSIPTYTSGTPGMQVSISQDFLNQAFYAFWGGGLLDQQLTDEDLGLDMSSFGTFLGMSDLTITTNPLLPPVVVPGTGDSLLDLQIGDLELTLYDGPPAPENIALRVYVTMMAGLELSVVDGNLSPELGDIELFFDVTTPANNTIGSADTEDLLDALVPMLLPQLTGALGSVPIPDIAGFSLVLDDIHLDGAENGYVTIDGDLAVE